MKNAVIDLMQMAGYEFVEEKPEGRLIFYETEYDNTVQLWYATEDLPFPTDTKAGIRDALKLITDRAYDRGLSFGKYSVRQSIKEALGIV